MSSINEFNLLSIHENQSYHSGQSGSMFNSFASTSKKRHVNKHDRSNYLKNQPSTSNQSAIKTKQFSFKKNYNTRDNCPSGVRPEAFSVKDIFYGEANCDYIDLELADSQSEHIFTFSLFDDSYEPYCLLNDPMGNALALHLVSIIDDFIIRFKIGFFTGFNNETHTINFNDIEPECDSDCSGNCNIFTYISQRLSALHYHFDLSNIRSFIAFTHSIFWYFILRLGKPLECVAHLYTFNCQIVNGECFQFTFCGMKNPSCNICQSVFLVPMLLGFCNFSMEIETSPLYSVRPIIGQLVCNLAFTDVSTMVSFYNILPVIDDVIILTSWWSNLRQICLLKSNVNIISCTDSKYVFDYRSSMKTIGLILNFVFSSYNFPIKLKSLIYSDTNNINLDALGVDSKMKRRLCFTFLRFSSM